MNSFCFILASSEDRSNHLERCITCMNNNVLYKNADIYLYWQGCPDSIPFKDRFAGIITADRLMGIFVPRYELFKQFGMQYEYTILIDDDLFVYSDTSYESAMAFLKVIDNNGICNLGRQFHKRRNELKMIDYDSDDYNVEGGMVFPNKCVRVLVDYFANTRPDVTEDIFWILLYVKGFDLYSDFSSNAIHNCHRPSKEGNPSGYFNGELKNHTFPCFLNMLFHD